MVTKKMDKFERMVSSSLVGRCEMLGPSMLMREQDAVTLLRQYHREVVGMVKQEQREMRALAKKTRESTQPADHFIADCLDSRVVECAGILDKLKELAK